MIKIKRSGTGSSRAGSWRFGLFLRWWANIKKSGTGCARVGNGRTRYREVARVQERVPKSEKCGAGGARARGKSRFYEEA